MGQTLLLNFCIGLGSEPFYLAGMLLRLLVVVDAHEKDVTGVFRDFRGICLALNLVDAFKYVAGVISL